MVLRRLLLPLGDAAMGHPMLRRLRHLEQAQWWSRQQLEAERDERLAEVAAIAYAEVPFYRELFESSGVNPLSIRSPHDLQRLPIVTKSMLRQNYPDRCCRKVGRSTYETSTSGSTGQNFWVCEDHRTAAWYRATFMLSLEWAGWKLGEPHLQIGMTTRRNLERRLKDSLMACHYVAGYDLSDTALDRCLNLLDRENIRHVWGYPGSLYALACRAEQRGCVLALKTVVTWGDQLHAPHRNTIERAFQVRVTDTYGCGEGMQIAAQCGCGPHYHIHELDVVTELVDETGDPVPDGEPGRVVLTRLHAGPMPFIRYDVGDLAVAEAQKTCKCGRNLRMLRTIQGRSADYILTPSGNRLIVHFFTGILEHFKEIGCFQVRQERPGSMRLLVVPKADFGPKVEQ